MIAVTLADSGPLPAGAQVAGQVIWTPEGEKQPRGIKVSLRWRTEGRGSTDMLTVAELESPVTVASAGMPVQVPFSLNLPIDGPVSYNGNLIRIIWELCVEIDLPWAFNEQAQQQLIVVPR